MHERMLDKTVIPQLTDLVEWCGESRQFFLDFIRYMSEEKSAQSEIRFPYGNSYGWCITFRRNKKLLCDVFAEHNAMNVMLRLPDKVFMQVYPTLTAYTQKHIDNRYPCGEGGWIHYRVSAQEQLDDIIKLVALK